MSDIQLVKVTVPSAPPANEFRIFFDTVDRRLKYIDEYGFTRTLTSVEWPKNQLINGGFNFMQRQIAGALTNNTPGVAARSYKIDRWFTANEANDTQTQQIDTITAPEAGLSHRFYAKVKKTAAVGKIAFGQIMTAENMAVLRGKRVRVNVRMMRTIAAAMTVRLGLVQLTAAGTHDTVPGWVAGAPSGTFVSAWGAGNVDPTLGTNLSRLTPVTNSADGGVIAGGGMNCDLTGAWARYSVAFDVPIDAKNLILMVWSDQQLAVNDELNVGEAQLTDGIEIIDWISAPQIVELERCHRFYCKSFSINVAPAQNAGLIGAWKGNAAQAGAVSFAHIGIRYPERMRAVPTVVHYNPSAANAFLRQIVTPSDATATSATNVTDTGHEVTATGLAAWVKGDGIAIHYQADAEL